MRANSTVIKLVLLIIFCTEEKTFFKESFKVLEVATFYLFIWQPILNTRCGNRECSVTNVMSLSLYDEVTVTGWLQKWLGRDVRGCRQQCSVCLLCLRRTEHLATDWSYTFSWRI